MVAGRFLVIPPRVNLSASSHPHRGPRRLLVWLSVGMAFAPGVRGADSIVLAWNAALLDAIRAETTPPPLAGRNLAIAHLVLDDTCRHDQGRPEVLAAIAGGMVSSALFPGRRGQFEQLREQMLDAISPAPTSEEWTAAMRCATDLLETRSADGASRSVTYVPRARRGDWRRTPPFFRPPELPQWPGVRTFAIADPKALVPAGPPALESTAWVAALDEVHRLGARQSGERTADQATTARFWSDFSYTTTPPGHWNEIAAHVARTRNFDERKTARLFAVLNVAMADAGIVCWEAKYRYNFWRPVTALADDPGDAWQPLLSTPAHPEYPSGHSAFSGAAAAVLAAFVGSDECAFAVRSDALPGVARGFHRFSDAAMEISLSRVYGGIHFRFSCEDGLQIGRDVAVEVLRWNAAEDAAPAREVASR